MALEALEAALVPTLLVVVTVKVYEVPLVRLVTMQVGVTGLPVFAIQVSPSGDEVAV